MCYHTAVNGPGDIWKLRLKVKPDAPFGNTSLFAHGIRFTDGQTPTPLGNNCSATINVKP
jgi:hypothetical protein